MTDWNREEFLATARWLEIEAQKHHAKAFTKRALPPHLHNWLSDTEYNPDEDFTGMQLDKAAGMIRQLLGET